MSPASGCGTCTRAIIRAADGELTGASGLESLSLRRRGGLNYSTRDRSDCVTRPLATRIQES
jgi:hypothetical protein